MAKSIMIQGTGSNVGKSTIVAGLCRVLTNRGYRVKPFKPQNMSNNAAAVDGGEIGRAQHLQALACHTKPHVDMNPVLLKPETETGAQVIVQGRRFRTVKAGEYAALKSSLLVPVIESYNRLKDKSDFVIVEGAGSPAEINLRQGDIANMGFARATTIPVVLVGDIDRGGVIAQIVGTKAVLDAADVKTIKGYLINRFRGDVSLFEDGIKYINKVTNWPSFGIVPWFNKAHILPAEDAQDLTKKSGLHQGALNIVCLTLSRITNFDDFDPLRLEPGLSVSMLPPGKAIPGGADIVIIPGSKSTRGDLQFIRQNGWDVDIYAHVRRGGRVLGICGGYQMLGRVVRDPSGIETTAGETLGLNLLNIETTMYPEKQIGEVVAQSSNGQPFSAYEIHLGVTTGDDTKRPFAWIEDNGKLRSDGAVSANGKVEGTYLHGLFANGNFRTQWLQRVGIPSTGIDYDHKVESTLDSLADHLESHVDINKIINVMDNGI